MSYQPPEWSRRCNPMRIPNCVLFKFLLVDMIKHFLQDSILENLLRLKMDGTVPIFGICKRTQVATRLQACCASSELRLPEVRVKEILVQLRKDLLQSLFLGRERRVIGQIYMLCGISLDIDETPILTVLRPSQTVLVFFPVRKFQLRIE